MAFVCVLIALHNPIKVKWDLVAAAFSKQHLLRQESQFVGGGISDQT